MHEKVLVLVPFASTCGKMASHILLFVFVSVVGFVAAVPEAGVKELSFNKDVQYHGFHKSLFSGAKIYITGECTNLSQKSSLEVKWTLFFSDCAQAYAGFPDDKLKDTPDVLYEKVGSESQFISANGPFSLVLNKTASPTKGSQSNLKTKPTKSNRKAIAQKRNRKPGKQNKNEKKSQKKNQSVKVKEPSSGKMMKNGNRRALRPQGGKPQSSLKPKNHSRHKRAVTNTTEQPSSTVGKTGRAVKLSNSHRGLVTAVTKDGNYLLRVGVSNVLDPESEYKIEITVKIKSDKYGFLSAAEWPLLPFYGAMSLLYLAYGVVWLIVSACQWRELLRIQFWIGGVIALGMLEKAVLFSEYNNVNNTGIPAHGLIVFSLVISCIKRTLSRILIIIVSLGFGIVKPRLGAALHRVLAVGFLYFVLCVVEGAYREKSLKADVENKQLIAAIPLSILDAVICWWIFMSLMQTMRTLRIRKNIVKLSLYRHFTNILVFSVFASVAFMIWSIKSYHLNACIKDWKELWIDEAFWHFLFAIVLLAIMVLWRPTANNQRYAFTPLIDVGEDDDDDDMTLSDAFNGMKMRNKSEGDVSSRADKNRVKLEDDLKWVEENIPTAGGIDTALPTLMDSDEEVMTTKLEMSKME